MITMKLFEFYHSPGEVETFNAWFAGQTGIVMKDGECGIYFHDYERWLEQGRLDHQCSHDWD